MTDYFRMYTCYDEKGNRFSIFGTIIEKADEYLPAYMQIWAWKCNKNDQYSKKLARAYYEYFLNTGIHDAYQKDDGNFVAIKPEVTLVEIVTGKPGKEFVQYCKNKYWSVVKGIEVTAEFSSEILGLRKGDTVIVHPDHRKHEFKIAKEILPSINLTEEI